MFVMSNFDVNVLKYKHNFISFCYTENIPTGRWSAELWQATPNWKKNLQNKQENHNIPFEIPQNTAVKQYITFGYSLLPCMQKNNNCVGCLSLSTVTPHIQLVDFKNILLQLVIKVSTIFWHHITGINLNISTWLHTS